MPSATAATVRRNFLRWEYLPEAALLGGLTVFLLDEPDAATSAFKSPKALAIMAAVTVGWLAARLLLARFLRVPAARAAVFSIAAAAALAVVVFPAYDDKTVVETFPTASPATADNLAAMADSPSQAAPAADSATSATSPGATQAAPAATASTTGPPMAAPPDSRPRTTPTAPVAPGPAATPTTTTTTTTTVAALPATATGAPDQQNAVPASGPQKIRSGSIRGIDHRASGTASIYRQPDGRFVVGLEDIDIQPGPDYDLYLVPGEDRDDTRGGTRLGDLRGNKGTQYYEVPPGLDLENGPWTVLVWCQTFAVPVAASTPS